MTLLDKGDRFPFIELRVAGAGVPTIELPGRLAGEYGIVLFYRGSWCPYCKEQLRAFQRAKDKLADVGARVLAVSVDDEPTRGRACAGTGSSSHWPVTRLHMRSRR